MLLGSIQYVLGGRYLGSAGLHPATTGDPDTDRRQKRNAVLAVGGGLAVFVVLALLGAAGVIEFTPTMISNGVGWLLLAISAVVFAWLIFSRGWSPEERKRSVATLVLFVAAATFWGAYEQAGSSLSLFAERSTNRVLFGQAFPASWYQFVPAFFVITLAPVFAWIWLALARRRTEPSSPAKFSLGLLFAALSFALLVPASRMAAGGRLAGPGWLLTTYFLLTVGELCLSPVGLSAMTKLAPARAAGFMMGIWFVSTSIGDWLAGKAASLYSSMPLPQLFGTVAAFSFVAAVVLALLIKPTVKLMSGVR
jgi:POT family proton-dependent oligopeptide transporter